MRDQRSSPPRSRIALILIAIFLGLACFYGATFNFRGVTDTHANSLQTRALVRHGDIDLARYPNVGRAFVVRRGHHVFSVYGAGISLVAAPIYVIASRSHLSDRASQGIVSLLIVAAAVVTLLYLLLRLVRPTIAAFAAVVFGLGTTMWPVAAMALYQHGSVALFQSIAMTGLFSRRRRAPLLAGFSFAMAAFIRPQAALPLITCGVVYLTEGWRRATYFIAGAIAPLLGIAIQNRWVWGSWFTSGYAQIHFRFNGSVARATFQLLLGWWRGLFVYSPFLILALPALAIALPRARGFTERRMIALAGASLGTVFLYARASDWTGGLNQFGYRYLLDVTPMLVVLSAWAWSRLDWLRVIAIPAGALSIMTMTFGMAPNRFAWDFIMFPRSFAEAPIGQAWIVFVHHPGQDIRRLLGVAAVATLIFLAGRKVSRLNEDKAGSRTLAMSPGS